MNDPVPVSPPPSRYQILFGAVADTPLTVGADPRHHLGGQLGFVAILHTWDQQLRVHVRLHGFVPGGALDIDGDRWVSARPALLFPVRALSRAFCWRFLVRLEAAFQQRRVVFPPRSPLWESPRSRARQAVSQPVAQASRQSTDA